MLYFWSYVFDGNQYLSCINCVLGTLNISGGLHDHPSPLNLLDRVKLIILGKNSSFLGLNKNTEDVSASEYVSTEVLRNTEIVADDVKLDHVQELEEEERITFGTTRGTEPCIATTSFQPTATTSSEEAHAVTVAELESDGLEYIAGYIAFTFKDKYNNLGMHSYKKSEHQYVPSRVENLSFGGLMVSETNFLNEV